MVKPIIGVYHNIIIILFPSRVPRDYIKPFVKTTTFDATTLLIIIVDNSSFGDHEIVDIVIDQEN